ncbi:hypothetical protein [Occallatibacter riparius]|uniref:Uncharacterized protein n=1 Tax=Occallatibacter riparius TaxID=1002689 RepID=A0A9J7BQ96_9BACT|nr:hypothetical protein [Occallatibacter riparius]UWZ84729.1 hypothetical protein MOP44_02050 [Occallatibacter riparius]
MTSPREYRDLVRQLIEIVSQGTLLIVHADCLLNEVLGPIWPGDSLSHDFQCTTCGRAFKLHVDTYHGGAGWEPVN